MVEKTRHFLPPMHVVVSLYCVSIDPGHTQPDVEIAAKEAKTLSALKGRTSEAIQEPPAAHSVNHGRMCSLSTGFRFGFAVHSHCSRPE